MSRRRLHITAGMDSFAHCADIARAGDRDRYVAALLAPPEMRPHLMALAAFDLETARVRDMVSEPMPGEIRLQWWRDAIHGDPGGHPVAMAVKQARADCGLPLAAFDSMIEARRFDLYDDAIPTLNDLEGYLGDTVSTPMQLAAICLSEGGDPETAELAGYAGVAVGLTRLLRLVPVHAARGQSYLPADLVAHHGVDLQTLFAGRRMPELDALLAVLRSITRDRLDAARQLIRKVPPRVLPAFLPAALVEPRLSRMELPGFDPLREVSDIGPLRRQWLIWRAARRGGF